MERSNTTLNDSPASGIEVPMADFNVAVIESDPSLRSQLISDLGERVRAAAFPTIESLEEHIEDGTPLVALLGPSCAGPAGLVAVERLTRSRPEVGTVLMVEALSTDVLQRALRAGVKDVLAAPVEASELVLAVERVGGTLTPAGVAAPSETGAPAGLRPPDHRVLDEGRCRQVGDRREPRGHVAPGDRADRSCSSTPTSSSATSR